VAIAAENLQAAESQIRDADMATEMVEYTKDSILTQASTAMLAQANIFVEEISGRHLFHRGLRRVASSPVFSLYFLTRRTTWM